MIRPTPKAIRVVWALENVNDAPTRRMEYAFYFLLFYSIMGDTFGISIPMLGGGILAILAASCLMRPFGSIVLKTLAFPLGCAASYVLIQLAVFDASLMAYRHFMTWISLLIITQSLCLRPAFFHRFAVATLVIGIVTLPYLQVISSSEIQRASLDRSVSIANPNDLAAWFGFCVVYFLILGFEAKRGAARIESWLIASGCLLVVGLTVSRGTLLAIGVATTVALRRILKKGFIPLLVLLILTWIFYEFGLFDTAASLYAKRGLEESGRFVLWPAAIQRFLDSPWVGVGESQTGTYMETTGQIITPHNGFLFISLASGIIPLILFIAYWWRAVRGALHARTKQLAEASFTVPLLIYAFLITVVGNFVFMFPHVIAAVAMGLSATVPRRLRRIVAHSRAVVSGPSRSTSINHGNEAAPARPV
jgi:O-antigen ligase